MGLITPILRPMIWYSLSLDFHGTASRTAAMDDATREQLSFVFAKLTGNLEDAASLALRGRHPQIDAEETEELIRTIQALLNHTCGP